MERNSPATTCERRPLSGKRCRVLSARSCMLLAVGIPLFVGCSPASHSSVSTSASGRTASHSGSSNSIDPAALGTVLPSDAFTSPMIDTVGGVDLYPPPAGVSAISEDTARQNLRPVAGPLSPSYVAKLALLSDSQDATRNANGTYVPNYVNRLVWAFIGLGQWSQSDGHLGAIGPGGKVITPQLPDGTTCTGVWLVDASTGAYLEGYSYCLGTGSSRTQIGP